MSRSAILNFIRLPENPLPHWRDPSTNVVYIPEVEGNRWIRWRREQFAKGAERLVREQDKVKKVADYIDLLSRQLDAAGYPKSSAAAIELHRVILEEIHE
jgi:hypothetical protein